MDSVTQAVLGAAVGQAVLGRRLGAKAALLGALGGTLPDLDVLFADSASVDYFVGHRGVSHSVFFGPLLALPLAWAGARWRPAIPFAPWWWFWMLVLLTHPLLDLFTSYGTQLLAPFSREPFAIPAISIIDPVYTLTLALGLGLALRGRHAALPAAFVLSSAYLGICALQNDRALQLARAQTNLPEVRATTTLFSPWLRRVMAWNGEELQIGFVSTWNPQPIRWQRLTIDPRASALAAQAEVTPLGRDFVRFANGARYPFLFKTADGGEELRIADARFGVPGSTISGFWGLGVPLQQGQLQPAQANRFQRLREVPVGGWAAMWAATWGLPQTVF
jgi:inner membrane protein